MSQRFDNFKNKHLNVGVGFGLVRNMVAKKGYYGGNFLAEIDYVFLKAFAVGVRTKPSFVQYKDVGSKLTIENNLFLRYYLIEFNCYNVVFYAEAGVTGDNSKYLLSGESIDKNKVYGYLGGGVAFLFSKQFKVQVATEFFYKPGK